MLRYSFLAVWPIMFAARPMPFATFLSAFGFRNQTLVRMNSTNPLSGLFVIFFFLRGSGRMFVLTCRRASSSRFNFAFFRVYMQVNVVL